MRPSRPFVVLSIFILSGCGTTDPSMDETTLPESIPTSSPQVTTPESVEFVTRTDTVRVLRSDEPSASDSLLATGEERFAVQIGAFREPFNASQTQNLARKRFHLPMLNEFDSRLGLYKIRLGSFTSRAEARTQMLRLQAEYPSEYNDSWIVQLTR
jgi:hypothetical protein